MGGYTKLWGSIIHSTVWREERHVKLVWITMLALSNKDGYVGASIPGLADAAGVTLHECEEALERLSAPDKYSRSKEYEGRRIEEVDRGWILLNYGKFREMQSTDRRREQVRQAVQRHRARKKSDIIKSKDIAEAEAEAEADPEYSSSKKKTRTCAYSSSFLSFWASYPKKESKGDAWKAWKQENPPLDQCLSVLETQKTSEAWLKDNGQFIPGPGKWIRARRWEDELPTKKPKSPSDWDLLTAAAEKERAEERQAARLKEEEEW